MTPHEAHHLWIQFVGLDNVADTLREEWDALPRDLLEARDVARAGLFVQEWLAAIAELYSLRE